MDKEFLRNPLILLKDQIVNFTKSKSKRRIALDFSIIASFFLLFFSIPACSFTPGLTKITWIITVVFLGLIFLHFVFYTPIKIDMVVLSLSSFCLVCLISSALNGFKMFSFTYLLLTIFLIVIYIFCKGDSSFCKHFLLFAYFGVIAFAILYIFTYRHELFTLNFNRLGSMFGDENDIAIYNCLGFAFSLYFLFNSKNLFIKVISFLLCGVFAFCSISSGSKIVIFLISLIFIFVVCAFNGKKRWWLSLIEILFLIALGVFLLNMPFASSLKSRFLSMISLFTNEPIKGAESRDLSTAGRLDMFLNGIEMFLRKPLFGFGINGFRRYGGLNNGWSHNHISEILCNTGIAGAITYHLPFALCYRKSSFRKDKTLYFLIIIFFTISMISIALPGEKMFCFIVGVSYASLLDLPSIFIFDLRKINPFMKSRRINNENC